MGFLKLYDTSINRIFWYTKFYCILFLEAVKCFKFLYEKYTVVIFILKTLFSQLAIAI